MVDRIYIVPPIEVEYMTKPLCIYHGNCADGFTAAWAVWMRFGDEFDYFPGVYQNPPPDVKGRDVVFVGGAPPLHAGNLMAQGEPFAACYWDTPDGRVFSLRSTDDGLDVSETAPRPRLLLVGRQRSPLMRRCMRRPIPTTRRLRRLSR